jgi:hypothetical protein
MLRIARIMNLNPSQERFGSDQSKMNADTNTPHCTGCGQPMKLARVTPRFGGLPELRTFECRPCGSVITESVDDPSRRSD